MKSMKRSNTRLASGVLVIATSLALSACGGSAKPSATEASATTATGSAETSAAETPETDAGASAAAPDAPCEPADSRTTIDGVAYICTLLTGKTLVWKPEASRDPSTSVEEAFGLSSSDEIPKAIENWGFDLEPYDPATGMAGVMKIKGAKTPKFDPTNPMDSRYLFIDYGDPESGHTDVQMAFFLPLGTPVLAMVTGVVCDVPKLYSGDFSVRIVPDGVECVREARMVTETETEHVINPIVKVGDHVTAGQQVATVSDYRKDWAALGFGVVEIGVGFVKKSDSSGWHACPARFLAPSRAAELTAALLSIHVAWEAESKNPDLYDEAAQSPLGCTTVQDYNG
jgi:hypothetical protein